MTDTPPEIERMIRDRLMARSGEERLIMGAQMFESACEMVRASLPHDLSATERRRRMLQRLYGNEIEVDKLVWA
jgi:short-subunit dehydrogenase